MSFTKDTNRIVWTEERQLNWNDFQGNPDYSDEFRSAVTVSAINFTTRCEPNGELFYKVSAQFLKDKSWVKPEAYSDYHLGHEQLHFDITELYVRKIREALGEETYQCDDQQLVQKLVKYYMQECLAMQDEYDKETRYSLHKAKQKVWEVSIQNQLANNRLFVQKE